MADYNVVLIDDNAIFRFIFENMVKNIENITIDFISYENALDALGALTAQNQMNSKMPDYIFVDINMPYMSGWEMMDKIQEESYRFILTSKIFIISSSHLESDKQKINQYPFILDYVQKPLNKEKLKELLTNA
ncbi:response regulator [Sphingobacterium litopenaei]|uniref:Response regulator n=1 Tax=Sphingobacterium litopenaei TaxID=2763500 RepID=A0ABR7YAP2_9SPHI|nr:response regulator [Sphingobacterium litopenaei]MBD1428355.1 response regulator [Sphingobacterium litopenaei]